MAAVANGMEDSVAPTNVRVARVILRLQTFQQQFSLEFIFNASAQVREVPLHFC